MAVLLLEPESESALRGLSSLSGETAPSEC